MMHARRLTALIALARVVGAAATQANPLAPAPAEGFVVAFDGPDAAGMFDGILAIGADVP